MCKSNLLWVWAGNLCSNIWKPGCSWSCEELLNLLNNIVPNDWKQEIPENTFPKAVEDDIGDKS